MQNAAPTWFLLGFFGVFVLGGLTGVMLAVVPFDWQAHDTYFVVAHLHYVMIGGLVFPVCAAIYYWAPLVSGKRLSERWGKWACASMFVGVNVAFFPMHIAGLAGMPRRVWTYFEWQGLDWVNLLSTFGAFIFAAGMAIVFADLILHLRLADKVNVNPWKAGTLEWLPTDHYATRSIPRVDSREPLWDHPPIREEVDSGQHYLPGPATGGRETIVTSAKEARPEYLLRLPGPSWMPLSAGVFTAAFFFLLTVKWKIAAAISGVAVLVCMWSWVWECDPKPTHRRYDIGENIRLPDYMSGRRSHSAWGMVVLLLVDGAIFASLLFSYFMLKGGSSPWPPAEMEAPNFAATALSAASFLASAVAVMVAAKALDPKQPRFLFASALIGALCLAVAGSYFHFHALDLAAIFPAVHAYGAVLHAYFYWQVSHVVLLTLMTAFTLARWWSGNLDAKRRVVFENTRLMWLYTSAQGLVQVLL